MRRVSPGGIAATLLLVGASTVIGGMVFGRSQVAEIVMVYFLAIVLVSLRWGRFEAIFAAVASVLSFDFFFVPPYHTFAAVPRYFTTFATMFLVATIISGLTQRVRDQRDRTATLYALSRSLAAAKTTADVVAAGAKHAREAFGADATLTVAASGAVAVDGGAAGEDRPYVDAFVAQIAASLERARLAEVAHQASLRVEAEQLRNSLLSSVSHDLRTPLAVITGNASTLLEDRVAPDVRRDLTVTIVEEAERLGRLVRNLLDMTRLEAGAVRVKKEWQPLEEVVGSALERMGAALDGRPVETKLPDDLPLVPFDPVLVQQVLVNLLENAVKHTPAGSPITIAARLASGAVEVTVADRGPGIVPGDEERVFEKFHRAEKGRGGGVGLGLTICRGIVVAHGGTIRASNREDGGAAFTFTLPIEGEPPALAAEAT